MRAVKLIIGPVCLLAATVGLGAESFRADINPALRYYQAFILAPTLSQEDRDYLFGHDWLGEKLPVRLGELVTRYGNEFRQVRAAASATIPCDWGVDMTPGPFTLFPHLAQCKGIAQAARLRAMWNFQNGRPEQARDDLLGALALARNTSRHGVLIAALVQMAMENIVCSAIAENFHQFPTELLQSLSENLDSAPARGTVAASVSIEVSSFVDWLESRIAELQKQNPQNDAKVMMALQELVDSFDGGEETPKPSGRPTLWQQVAKAAGGTSAGVVKLLDQARPFYPRLTQMMNLSPTEYEEQIKSFNADILGSKNPFMSQLFGAWDKSRRKEFAVLAELSMVRAAIEYKLRGETGLRSVRDLGGQGAFTVERFLFNGVDRGFKLTSSYQGRGFPEVLIFVEKDGTPFYVTGNKAGKPLPKPAVSK